MSTKTFALIVIITLVSWGYQATRPPPPRIYGSPGGPPITAPRLRLRDGRHLAYEEYGVPRESAKFKIISVHGYDSTRHHAVFLTLLSKEFVEELGIYIVGFDRPGYGESDPHPERTRKSLALDIEELGDQLGLGPKFYVLGNSMGGQVIWMCLKYIPHRLAGAGLIAPAINYYWPSFPTNISSEVYNQLSMADQWTLRIAHHLPWLTYWWNTRKFLPASSFSSTKPEDRFSPRDIEMLNGILNPDMWQKFQLLVRQQGEYESLHRDMKIVFGKWEFDPIEIENPFPNNEGSVHLWQGDEDNLVPVKLQRFIVEKLPWIHYHELQGVGHLIPLVEGMCETMFRQFLVEKK